MDWRERVKFACDGLVPVVVQDASCGQVLMLAYADAEAVSETVRTGEAHFYSRSRQALWRKGETSGCRQIVREVVADCDGDALLYRVHQVGTACHEGPPSCFHRVLTAVQASPDPRGQVPAQAPYGSSRDGFPSLSPDLFRLAILDHLWKVILNRGQQPRPGSYVASLLTSGADVVWRKVGEEAVECICAALKPPGGAPDHGNAPDRVDACDQVDAPDHEAAGDHLVAEAADLLFHLWVALARMGIHPDRVLAELDRRRQARTGGTGDTGGVIGTVSGGQLAIAADPDAVVERSSCLSAGG